MLLTVAHLYFWNAKSTLCWAISWTARPWSTELNLVSACLYTGVDLLASSDTDESSALRAPPFEDLVLSSIELETIGVGQSGLPIKLRNSRFGKQTLIVLIRRYKSTSWDCSISWMLFQSINPTYTRELTLFLFRDSIFNLRFCLKSKWSSSRQLLSKINSLRFVNKFIFL